MPNVLQRMGMWFAQQVASYLSPERVQELNKLKSYYEGDQKRPLKLKAGQSDDNLITNWLGLSVDRSNSMLFGGGVDFSFPEQEATPRKQYIENTWKANKQEIFLHRWGVDGEIFGTGFIEIMPDGIEYNGVMLPRLVLLDPTLMSIETDPLDIEKVIQYVFEVKVYDAVIRRVVRRTGEQDVMIEQGLEDVGLPDSWIVETWKAEGGNGNFKLMDKIEWPYPFPPIIHNQNLPSVHSVNGVSGIKGADDVQDKYNFVIANMLKIVRYHSHPKTWGRGLPANAGNLEKVSWGADEIIKISSENGSLANLEMSSDLSSSRNIANDLRSAIFSLTRVVDVAGLGDKLGQLTNFGLHVLYSDALSKNATRRALYGEALQELNRRLLLIGGFEGMDSNPPEIEWGPDMPANDVEDAALILNDLNAALISKATASELRGYDWEGEEGQSNGEKDKIAQENSQGNAGINNALSGFFAGR